MMLLRARDLKRPLPYGTPLHTPLRIPLAMFAVPRLPIAARQQRGRVPKLRARPESARRREQRCMPAQRHLRHLLTRRKQVLGLRGDAWHALSGDVAAPARLTQTTFPPPGSAPSAPRQCTAMQARPTPPRSPRHGRSSVAPEPRVRRSHSAQRPGVRTGLAQRSHLAKISSARTREMRS